MSRITQKAAVSPIEVFKTSTDTAFTTYTGQKFDSSDGREFTLIRAGAVNLASGVLVQGEPIVANHQNIAIAANAAAGATQVTVTLGATAATANFYAGGYLIVNDGTGEGQTLKIASNPAADLSTNMVVTLEDPIVTSITAAGSEVSLFPNPYKGVVINPTTPTNIPVGVTLYPITATYYGLVTSKGLTSCLIDGAPAAGAAISPSNATAGAVESGVIAQGFVGKTAQLGVSTEYNTVYIDC